MSRMERTLVLIKPDAVRRGLTRTILERFMGGGFNIYLFDYLRPTVELVEAHYRKKFREHPEIQENVVRYLTSGPIVVYILVREDDAISAARNIVGPLENAPLGTLRGDFGADHLNSLVHASDSPEAAEYEIKIWFPSPSDRKRKERELLFAMAVASQRNGDTSAAGQYAQQCLDRLAQEADNAPREEISSLECALTVGDHTIMIPGLLHTGTALREFRAAGIEI